jgi:hypothetical protein
MILHVLGDSHRIAIFNAAKETGLQVTEDLGEGYTIARIGAQKLELINIADKNKFNISEGDAICFVFGEIDCRTHLCKPKNFKNYKELIDEIVLRYFEAIKMNAEQYKNLKVLVNNVVPAVSVIDNPQLLEHYGPQTNTPYPFNGTDEERKIVADYMHVKYKEYCKKFNFIFIDVYDKYCDEKGMLLRYRIENGKSIQMSDTTHIWNNIYLKEFFINNIIPLL